jgi:hypothetical protein
MTSLSKNTLVNFISRYCKQGEHQNCDGWWQGFGFEIVCDCKCAHNKKRWTLAEVWAPKTNAIHEIPSSSKTSKEVIQRL